MIIRHDLAFYPLKGRYARQRLESKELNDLLWKFADEMTENDLMLGLCFLGDVARLTRRVIDGSPELVNHLNMYRLEQGASTDELVRNMEDHHRQKD